MPCRTGRSARPLADGVPGGRRVARARRRLQHKVIGAGRDERTPLRFSRISIARCADLVRSPASAWGPLSRLVHPITGARARDQRPCARDLRPGGAVRLDSGGDGGRELAVAAEPPRAASAAPPGVRCAGWVYKGSMDRRALVLGGGGVTGIAWEIGVIAGLADQGIDLAAADVVIGTSAGSVVGADITSGQQPEALYQAQLAPPDPEPAARIGWGLVGRLAWVMNTSRDPVRARARIGRWALAARVMPEASRRTVFEARLPTGGWPATMLKVTAVDARTGEFVVFDAAGEASLVDAVGASCAVPGVWPPVTIGNRRFVDGGVRSVANADLAASYQRVVIVAPVAQGIGPIMPGPSRQAAALAAAGARVALVRPDRAAMRAIGRNVLDVSHRAAAATAGRAQAAAEAAAVRAVWQPGRLLAVRPGTGSARPRAQGSRVRVSAPASGTCQPVQAARRLCPGYAPRPCAQKQTTCMHSSPTSIEPPTTPIWRSVLRAALQPRRTYYAQQREPHARRGR